MFDWHFGLGSSFNHVFFLLGWIKWKKGVLFHKSSLLLCSIKYIWRSLPVEAPIFAACWQNRWHQEPVGPTGLVEEGRWLFVWGRRWPSFLEECALKWNLWLNWPVRRLGEWKLKSERYIALLPSEKVLEVRCHPHCLHWRLLLYQLQILGEEQLWECLIEQMKAWPKCQCCILDSDAELWAMVLCNNEHNLWHVNLRIPCKSKHIFSVCFYDD